MWFRLMFPQSCSRCVVLYYGGVEERYGIAERINKAESERSLLLVVALNFERETNRS